MLMLVFIDLVYIRLSILLLLAIDKQRSDHGQCHKDSSHRTSDDRSTVFKGRGRRTGLVAVVRRHSISDTRGIIDISPKTLGETVAGLEEILII